MLNVYLLQASEDGLSRINDHFKLGLHISREGSLPEQYASITSSTPLSSKLLVYAKEAFIPLKIIVFNRDLSAPALFQCRASKKFECMYVEAYEYVRPPSIKEVKNPKLLQEYTEEMQYLVENMSDPINWNYEVANTKLIKIKKIVGYIPDSSKST